MPSEVLVPHIDNKARRSRRRCLREPVLPSAPCVHKCTHLTHSPPHTILKPCTHHCTPVTESSTAPTQCAMTAQPPCTAAHCTAAHPRPSPCTHILTRTSTPDLPPRIQHPVVQCHSSTAALFPRLLTSCTDAYLHVLASPRVHDTSHLDTAILSQQQLREQPLLTKYRSQQPCHPSRVRYYARSPRASNEVSCHFRNPLPRYSDWLSLALSCRRSRMHLLTERPYPRRTRSVQCRSRLCDQISS